MLLIVVVVVIRSTLSARITTIKVKQVIIERLMNHVGKLFAQKTKHGIEIARYGVVGTIISRLLLLLLLLLGCRRSRFGISWLLMLRRRWRCLLLLLLLLIRLIRIENRKVKINKILNVIHEIVYRAVELTTGRVVR